MRTLSKALGLKLEIATPSDGLKWGEEVSPGKFSGLAGDITGAISDIGFGNTFIKLSKMKYMDFTAPFYLDRVCYMVILCFYVLPF